MSKKAKGSDEEEEELGPEYFQVEKVLDKVNLDDYAQRVTSRGVQYLIQWKNYPRVEDRTWEPPEHLEEIKDMLAEFDLTDEEKRKKKEIKEVKAKKKEEEEVFEPSRL